MKARSSRAMRLLLWKDGYGLDVGEVELRQARQFLEQAVEPVGDLSDLRFHNGNAHQQGKFANTIFLG
jgi:hypothetical protein